MFRRSCDVVCVGAFCRSSSDGEYLAGKMREKGLILEDVGNACGGEQVLCR